jgi:hypothetical protein
LFFMMNPLAYSLTSMPIDAASKPMTANTGTAALVSAYSRISTTARPWRVASW